MHKKVEPKMQFSPRLGIAYPITDRGVIHFSYGHFFQLPEFQYLYTNPDFKLSPGGGYGVFGNADLYPQKTVMYEIGLQQQITQDLGVDATLFYRDVRDWVGTSPLYTMRAIIAGGSENFNQLLVYGGLSCVFWTLTLSTTIKYILITTPV